VRDHGEDPHGHPDQGDKPEDDADHGERADIPAALLGIPVRLGRPLHDRLRHDRLRHGSNRLRRNRPPMLGSYGLGFLRVGVGRHAFFLRGRGLRRNYPGWHHPGPRGPLSGLFNRLGRR
jgi:hypothetical protein